MCLRASNNTFGAHLVGQVVSQVAFLVLSMGGHLLFGCSPRFPQKNLLKNSVSAKWSKLGTSSRSPRTQRLPDRLGVDQIAEPAIHPLRRIRMRRIRASIALNPAFLETILSGAPPLIAYGRIDIYTNNQERLLNQQVIGRLLEKLMGAPELKLLPSDEHLPVKATCCRLRLFKPHWSPSGLGDSPPPPSG